MVWLSSICLIADSASLALRLIQRQPPGVPLDRHAIWSALPIFLDSFSWRKTKVMSRRYFKKRFAQTAPKDQADALWQQRH